MEGESALAAPGESMPIRALPLASTHSPALPSGPGLPLHAKVGTTLRPVGPLGPWDRTPGELGATLSDEGRAWLLGMVAA